MAPTLDTLTDAQRRALDWLPGDGEAVPVPEVAADTLGALSSLGLVQIRWRGGDPTMSGWSECNCTPAGLALKAGRTQGRRLQPAPTP